MDLKENKKKEEKNKNLNSIVLFENSNWPQNMNHIWIDNLANFMVGKLSNSWKWREQEFSLELN